MTAPAMPAGPLSRVRHLDYVILLCDDPARDPDGNLLEIYADL